MNFTLRIGNWNANGLLKHLSELELFLKHQKIDVCLISETHFTKHSFVNIRGFVCYHSPHPANKARGGSAVLIKDNILHWEEPAVEEEMMQVTTVSIQSKKKLLKISAIYCPPRHSPSKDDFKSLFKTLGSCFVIGGDYNAKHTHWGSRLITTKGKELYHAGLEYKCTFLSSGSPTYWPTDPQKLPDLIDFFVAKGINCNYISVESNHDLSSDHTPVILTVSKSIIQKPNLPRLCTKKTNWDEFRAKLQMYLDLEVPLETKEEIDRGVEQFIADIQQAAEESTPPQSRNIGLDTSYPMEVRELVLEKRRARRKWQQSRYPDDKVRFNRLSNQLKKRIKEIKNEALCRFLSNLTADENTEYSLWKAAKKIKRPKIQNPPLKMENGLWATNSMQKANLFAKYLAGVFSPFPKSTDQENISSLDRNDKKDIQFVTLKELKNMIRCNISAKKSPGYDLITGQIMKELPDMAIIRLQHMINACFKVKYVPHHWKIAEVILILKPGKPSSAVTSYRPISLLPVMSKIFEKLLLRRLEPIIRDRQLIPTHQFGFRRRHSTIDQIHRIINVIEKALEEKKICSAVFLDVAQAFDKVWHEGLEYKLHRDLPTQYFELLQSYIKGRYFRVRHGCDYSELKRITAGVPQGSVLGPVLYLLYTRDIPDVVDSIVATFADDTAILAVDACIEKATSRLQGAMDKISTWTKCWRIKLNEAKSTHINFTNRKIITHPLFINAQAVPYSNNAKYLGMTLDTKLKWKVHVKKKVEELRIKYRKLYWLLGRNSGLTVQNKILIYNQILKPVWTYGIQLWGCTKQSNIQIIQKFQNKVLRGIVNAPWYIRNGDLHRDLNIRLVEEEIKKCAISHNLRLLTHENLEMRAVLEVADNVRRLKRIKPHELLQ